ncbi:plant virulence effector HPE1-like domain-containing protein [Rhizobium sp. 25PS6]|uniref:plant virulence effector HPE1-like domain-containing protein n=1 Tax=Rhizobium sp. 25PS6 TaxID=3075622 RepID=UPI0028FD5108|nr:plant virulence effector HPE1-like domain-containing protein [Rhizobium sp. 25PS6]MDU0363271.1 plant virulence effector HPE1-like domain-containing protein [Rhizobium sp. 25PS6]
MRQIFLGAAVLLMAGSAMASSIEVVGKTAPSAEGSIVTESCAHCPPLQAELTKKDYTVPELKPGVLQASEIRDVGGEKKIYRTEGWMGGSPVVFVSKATPEAMLAAAPSAPPADGIDMNATTAAVIGGDAKPVAAGMAELPAALNVSEFKLRF